jgi:hypothetical protein
MSLIFAPLYAAISIINRPLLWFFPQLDVFNFWVTVLYVAVAPLRRYVFRNGVNRTRKVQRSMDFKTKT